MVYSSHTFWLWVIVALFSSGILQRSLFHTLCIRATLYSTPRRWLSGSRTQTDTKKRHSLNGWGWGFLLGLFSARLRLELRGPRAIPTVTLPHNRRSSRGRTPCPSRPLASEVSR